MKSSDSVENGFFHQQQECFDKEILMISLSNFTFIGGPALLIPCLETYLCVLIHHTPKKIIRQTQKVQDCGKHEVIGCSLTKLSCIASLLPHSNVSNVSLQQL